MAARTPAALGEIIRRQRELAELSVRQFAERAGISNPYLSQIERGLRAPSDRVLDSIAQALELSAETLYEEAGIAPPDSERQNSAVLDAIATDARLSGRQRSALREVYTSFVAEAPAPRKRRTS